MIPLSPREVRGVGIVYVPILGIELWSEVDKKWLRIFLRVDTGADVTVLSKEIQDRILPSKRLGDVELRTASGETLRCPIYKVKMRIISKKIEKDIIVAFQHSKQVPDLLGVQAMKGFRITIDAKNNTFRIE